MEKNSQAGWSRGKNATREGLGILAGIPFENLMSPGSKNKVYCAPIFDHAMPSRPGLENVWKTFDVDSVSSRQHGDFSRKDVSWRWYREGILDDWVARKRTIWYYMYVYIHIYVYARIIAYPPQRIAGGFSRNFSRVSQIAKCNREQLGPAKLQDFRMHSLPNWANEGWPSSIPND